MATVGQAQAAADDHRARLLAYAKCIPGQTANAIERYERTKGRLESQLSRDTGAPFHFDQPTAVPANQELSPAAHALLQELVTAKDLARTTLLH